MPLEKSKQIGKYTLLLVNTHGNYEMSLSKGEETIFSLPFAIRKGEAHLGDLDYYYDDPKSHAEIQRRVIEMRLLHDFMEDVMREKRVVARGSTTAANARALKRRKWKVRLNDIKTIGHFEKDFRTRRK